MTADTRPDNWIWVDFETTTLDERHPTDSHILEIGLAAVDAKLQIVCEWSSPVKYFHGDLADCLRRCGTLEMHQNSGLYAELTSGRAHQTFESGGLPTLAEAEAVACQFVATFAPPVYNISDTHWAQIQQAKEAGYATDLRERRIVAGSPLCGSNVGKFDWLWMREKMPKLAAMFHYRCYDTNFAFMSEQRFGGGSGVKTNTRHRALDDCHQSINTVRTFFGLPVLGGTL
jgi:oligoribonuclease (3'-5' exoribonuclease)